MTEEHARATGLARAEQIIETHIEDRTIPDPLVFSAAAQHAQAIATVELAKAQQLTAILQALALDDANQVDPNSGMVLAGMRGPLEHRARILLSKLIPREEPNA